jgi:hypothetical protein
VPTGRQCNFEEQEEVMHLAPMLAAALAVNEAFLYIQGFQPAGRRNVGMSLWNPTRLNWELPDLDAASLCYLPSHLWLIGLGNLGQAYLWGLSLLPYEQKEAGLRLVLQDTDVVTISSPSTSVLSTSIDVGKKKTRAMAAWAERCGFKTVLLERAFAPDFRINPEDPIVALCGLDNKIGRCALDQVGFKLVIEAGLGRGYKDFRAIRLHTLPGPRRADDIWKGEEQLAQIRVDNQAYKKMLEEGNIDRCGVALLAGKAVGAPFVGSVAACLVLGELLRFMHGGKLHNLIDMDLQDPDYRQVGSNNSAIEVFNPGYVSTQ